MGLCDIGDDSDNQTNFNNTLLLVCMIAPKSRLRMPLIVAFVIDAVKSRGIKLI